MTSLTNTTSLTTTKSLQKKLFSDFIFNAKRKYILSKEDLPKVNDNGILLKIIVPLFVFIVFAIIFLVWFKSKHNHKKEQYQLSIPTKSTINSTSRIYICDKLTSYRNETRLSLIIEEDYETEMEVNGDLAEESTSVFQDLPDQASEINNQIEDQNPVKEMIKSPTKKDANDTSEDSLPNIIKRPNTLNFFTPYDSMHIRKTHHPPFTPDPDLTTFPTPLLSRSDRIQNFGKSLSFNTTTPKSITSMIKPRCGLLERRGSSVHLTISLNQQDNPTTSLDGESVSQPPSSPCSRRWLRKASLPLSPNSLHIKSYNSKMLQKEFWDIPLNHPHEKDVLIAGHGTKNRYRTILPNPHSRVHLKTFETDVDPLTTYINANYIRNCRGDLHTDTSSTETYHMQRVLVEDAAYIATQGPMLNTVNDFWQMVWQNNVQSIIMITKMKEYKEKCCEYFPQSLHQSSSHAGYQLKVVDVRQHEYFSIRTFEMKSSDEDVRTISHFWYTGWLDHQTPEKTKGLLELVQEMLLWHRDEDHGPIVVHCSAGIGRTGCFIAVVEGCQQLLKFGKVDILKIVSQMRLDRGGMIQTCEQYTFVHQALSRYARIIAGENVMTPSTTGSLRSPNNKLFTPHDIDLSRSDDPRRWRRSHSTTSIPIPTSLSPHLSPDLIRDEDHDFTTVEAFARVCLRPKDLNSTDALSATSPSVSPSPKCVPIQSPKPGESSSGLSNFFFPTSAS